MATEERLKTLLVVSNNKASDGQVVITPRGTPNLVLRVITPLATVLFRAAKAYLVSLVGMLGMMGMGLSSTSIPAADFLHSLKIAAGFAVATGVMSLLVNLTLLFTQLSEDYPILKS